MKCVKCKHYYETHDKDDDYVSKCDLLKGDFGEEHKTIDGFSNVYHDFPLGFEDTDNEI